MKKQTFTEYIFSRIEFSIAVGLFMEFDYETKLVSDFPEPRHPDEVDIIVEQVLKFKKPNIEAYTKDCIFKGDISFPCMSFAKIFRQSPIAIAEKLQPYVDEWDFIEKTEFKGGYLNMFFNREMFFNEAMKI